jgi:hypothetical protein
MQTTSDVKSLFAAEKKLTFFLLCLATFLLLYIKKAFIESETAAFLFLEDRPEGGILQLLTAIQFLSIPLVYLWKFTVIAFVIWVGSFMFGYRITYSQCWGLVIVCEFTFLLPELVKIFWFMFVETDPRLSDVNAFYPLSLMNFFDYYEMDKRYVYPLKALNVFEVAYWFLLVEGVHHFARKKRQVAWIIVSCSYILIFFLWLWFYVVVYK